ncbi:MAG: hypothetical protein IH614_07065, partial [Desulfuromonadales bacterium]|nr:hypothetical protein [Desulfuromonadales bacterium]
MTSEQVQAVVEMMRHLAKAFASASYYSPSHPQVIDILAPILDALRRALAKAPELTLIIVKDDLLLLGKPLERNPSVTRVAVILSRCGLGHLRFAPEVEEAD